MIEAFPIGFEMFELDPDVARAIRDAGYVQPTPIQQAAIPLLRSGRDLIAQAQTGTGKTAAFGIPAVELADPSLQIIQVLILTPTRELALQVSAELAKLGKYRSLGIATVYGGTPMRPQIDAIPHSSIIVGTPGRVLDLARRGAANLATVGFLVLDEADRMLDMGFLPDVERIIRLTPRGRQTALFSATITPLVRRLALRYMRDPESVAIAPEERTVSSVRQIYYEVAERDKLEALIEVLEREQPQSALIFCHTQTAADLLARRMEARGLPARAIHARLSQPERERTLAAFRAGKVRYLVATNLAARGLDILHVSHVLNYDVPEDADTYVHRIGRTARMGRPGTAITFVAEWDDEALAAMKKVAGDQLQAGRLELYSGVSS